METIRVELPDGAWWDIKSYLTRGDRRKIDTHVQEQAFSFVARIKAMDITTDQLRALAGTPTNGAAPGNPDEDDMLLLCATVGWSFPDQIAAETIAARWERHTNQVLARMHELYVITDESLKN